MLWIVRKLSQFYEMHPWIYRLCSWSLAALFALCLLVYFLLLTPVSVYQMASWSTPPEFLEYRKYWLFFLSLGLLFFLLLALAITLLGPFYFQHKSAADAAIRQYIHRISARIKNSKVKQRGLLFALITWVLSWSIFTLWLLSGAYPPNMIEIIGQSYDISMAEHFSGYIHSVFYQLLFAGCTLAFSPLFLVCYFRLKVKGAC
ncbi:hypothetical protein O4H49_04420 [Kiloniella laminariae]|uniref:Glycerophosphoryl diester phosphodiesterase membrane domain-containing protein n=1 Tax=Kiloniella laminariae TaxID=454162 RepID=A0ABT4LFY5_9PROT|nr:hypothetical protein [Kiloniella laminariae]MCZ4280010.1 hypothetical protein [Kiloniella laminariae]